MVGWDDSGARMTVVVVSGGDGPKQKERDSGNSFPDRVEGRKPFSRELFATRDSANSKTLAGQ